MSLSRPSTIQTVAPWKRLKLHPGSQVISQGPSTSGIAQTRLSYDTANSTLKKTHHQMQTTETLTKSTKIPSLSPNAQALSSRIFGRNRFRRDVSGQTATEPAFKRSKSNEEIRREILLFDMLSSHRLPIEIESRISRPDVENWGVTMFRKQYEQRSTLFHDFSLHYEIRDRIDTLETKYCNSGIGLRLYTNEFKWLSHEFEPESYDKVQEFVSFATRRPDGSSKIDRMIVAEYLPFLSKWKFTVGNPERFKKPVQVPLYELILLQLSKSRWDICIAGYQRVAEERNKPLVVQGNYRRPWLPQVETHYGGIPHNDVDAELVEGDEQINDEGNCTLPVLETSDHPLAVMEARIESEQRMKMEEGLPYVGGEEYRPYSLQEDMNREVGDQGDHNWRQPVTLLYPMEALQV